MSGRLLSKIALSILVVALSGVIAVHGQNSGRPQDRINTGNPAGTVDAESFAARVHDIALGQIYLGHLALERSSNDQVRTLATKAIDDSVVLAQKSQTEKAVQDSNVTIQRSKPGQFSSDVSTTLDLTQVSQAYRQMGEKLTGLTGADFDREYLRMLIDGQRTLVDELEHAPSGKVHHIQPRDASGRPTVRTSPANVEPDTIREPAPQADLRREMLPTARQNLYEAERIRGGSQ
jgi:predicted outer membrane protein